MKKSTIYVLSSILFLSTNLISQNTETDDMATSDAVMPPIQKEAVEEINFIELYEIDAKKVKKAKTLCDASMSSEPSASSDLLEIIPKGTTVETYKYLRREAVWVVKHKNTWGFVSATMIMPVQEKIPATNFTPYDEAPKLLSGIKIEYPPKAKQNGIEGKVLLKILISKTGAVKEVEVIKSIPELDDAAIKAIKNVKFKPGKYQRKPVDVWVRIPINFEIESF